MRVCGVQGSHRQLLLFLQRRSVSSKRSSSKNSTPSPPEPSPNKERKRVSASRFADTADPLLSGLPGGLK